MPDFAANAQYDAALPQSYPIVDIRESESTEVLLREIRDLLRRLVLAVEIVAEVGSGDA